MPENISSKDCAGLVRELCKLPHETEWVEFKVNHYRSEEIGEYVSALSNSAALMDEPFGYLVWGISDQDHQIVGTNFTPGTAKGQGNQDLESWLHQMLEPHVALQFVESQINGLKVVCLRIGRAKTSPVQFKRTQYIRVGSTKRNLIDFPEKAHALWHMFDYQQTELKPAARNVTDNDVLELLDCQKYFEMLDLPMPDKLELRLEVLADDNVINRRTNGGWDITNLGAVLFAKKLKKFPNLTRKHLRVMLYDGTDPVKSPVKDFFWDRGYATGFDDLVDSILRLIPDKETYGPALRKVTPRFPPKAVREAVANALIHQDLSITGEGLSVSILDDRLIISNPGRPLTDRNRFVDKAPKTRNNEMAALMRRENYAEERGSGWDQIVEHCERLHLPAPLVSVPGDTTRVEFYAFQPLSKMERADRVRSIYLHACLRYVRNSNVSNASVRERFGIGSGRSESVIAWRLIKEAIDEGVIVPVDSNASNKNMRYEPRWLKKWN